MTKTNKTTSSQFNEFPLVWWQNHTVEPRGGATRWSHRVEPKGGVTQWSHTVVPPCPRWDQFHWFDWFFPGSDTLEQRPTVLSTVSPLFLCLAALYQVFKSVSLRAQDVNIHRKQKGRNALRNLTWRLEPYCNTGSAGSEEVSVAAACLAPGNMAEGATATLQTLSH